MSLLLYLVQLIDHFRKMSQSSPVNLNAVQNKVVSSSPEDCAFKCLNDSSGSSPGSYKCLSFDVCRNPVGGPSTSSYVCAFYDRSFVTDPSVILEGQPSCDHYSSLLQTFYLIRVTRSSNLYSIDFDFKKTLSISIARLKMNSTERSKTL